MRHIQRVDLLEAIGKSLQRRYTTTQINSLLRTLGITEGLEEIADSKRVYAIEKLSSLEDEKLVELAQELDVSLPDGVREGSVKPMSGTARTVFAIHGRNERLRSELFTFLRAAGLDPLEWSEAVQLTEKGSPYIGEILDCAFEEAAAVVVLLSPDDVVRLSDELLRESDGPNEREPRLQPRPNVIFEAGMAFGRYPERTILVSVGRPKDFSDVAGRHVVHLSNDPENRLDLLSRLETAGCAVRSSERRDWLAQGDFELDLSSSPGDLRSGSASKELNETEAEILRVLAGSERLLIEQVASALEISPVATQHYLETLEEEDYVHGQHVIGGPSAYGLGKRGRAYAVEHGLV